MNCLIILRHIYIGNINDNSDLIISNIRHKDLLSETMKV